MPEGNKIYRPELARALGVNPQTLANWASNEIGPKWNRVDGGRVFYLVSDVTDWATGREKYAERWANHLVGQK